MSAAIPHILHQTYASSHLPRALRRFQKTWRDNHPKWRYYFWTDDQIRDFLRQHYESFLPIFDGYPQDIMRVDAFRYFLLYHYGGVYADLDAESVQPLDSLVLKKRILLTQETEAHTQKAPAAKRGLSCIVSNAFMGSVAKHPFWLDVIKQLEINCKHQDVLDATGPFMLTQVYMKYAHPFSLTSDHTFCSLADTRLTSGRQAQSGYGNRMQSNQASQVYAIHHWFGSWWKKRAAFAFAKESARPLIQFFLRLFSPNYRIRAYLAKQPIRTNPHRVIGYSRGRVSSDEVIDSSRLAMELQKQKNLPLVSALMITKNRPELAWRAIECFLSQSYSAKELVIIDEGELQLQKLVRQLNSPLIRYYRNESPKKLGRLRNQAIRLAEGEYVCQWDDDDLYHPTKIAHQIAVCLHYQADACFLLRELLWNSRLSSLAISDNRLWEGTILARKQKIGSYPSLRRGEDYWVIHKLAQYGSVVALDYPELYLYTYHHINTWSDKHFAKVWRKASKIYFLADEQAVKMNSLVKDYPHLS